MKILLQLFICFTLLKANSYGQTVGTWQATSGARINTTNNIFIVSNNMNFINNGTFVQGIGNGTTIIKGNTNTTTSGSGNTTFDKLEVAMDNGFSHTLTSPVNIKNVITLTSGQLVSDGFLTLTSDTINTARVAPISSTALPAIAGNVMVERFIKGNSKYRLLTSSVTTSPLTSLSVGQEEVSIWGNWQNRGNDTIANTGTIITGGTVADGFDQPTTNVSMFTYDDANRKYVGFSSALGKSTKYTPLKAGVAYYIFVVGDRTNDFYTTTPKNTVIKQFGTLLQGDQTYTTSSANPISNVVGRFTLLGNPFASPINWASVTKTNIANTYWGWDPNLSSTGGYVTVNTVGDAVVISPLTGTTELNQFIQPGQGFFIKTTAVSPALTIGEQHKTNNINNNVFRNAGSNKLPLIAINLQYKSGGKNVVADGAVAIFDPSFNNHTGPEDATKFVGRQESVSIQNGDEFLSIYGRQMPAANDTLFLHLAKLTRSQYQLQIFEKNWPGTVTPYLRDNYLQTIQPLSVTDTNLITVKVNLAEPASLDAKRFQIVFQPSTVLPIKFISINAVKNNQNVLVEWKPTYDESVIKYEIERSVNGIDFIKVGEIAVRQNSWNAAYQWTDYQPSGYNYYRVRAIQTPSKFYYSKVVTVRLDLLLPSLSIFPNPIQNQTIRFVMKGFETGTYTIKILGMGGRVVYHKSIQHDRNVENHFLKLSTSLSAGSYIISITNNGVSLSELLLVK